MDSLIEQFAGLSVLCGAVVAEGPIPKSIIDKAAIIPNIDDILSDFDQMGLSGHTGRGILIVAHKPRSNAIQFKKCTKNTLKHTLSDLQKTGFAVIYQTRDIDNATKVAFQAMKTLQIFKGNSRKRTYATNEQCQEQLDKIKQYLINIDN